MALRKGSKEKKVSPDIGEEFKKLQETMNNLPEQLSNQLGSSIVSALKQANAEALRASEQTNNSNDDDDADEDDFENVDLEKMSRSDFAKFLFKGFGKTLDKRLGGVQKELKDTRTQAETRELSQRYQAAAEKYPDFMDWKKEIKQRLENNPGAANLDPEDLYLLVRARDPDKAAELDKKYSKGSEDGKTKSDEGSEEKAAEEGKDKSKASPFRGLVPTIHSTPSDDDADDDAEEDDEDTPKFNTPKDAAAAAFDSAFKNIDPELISGNPD